MAEVVVKVVIKQQEVQSSYRGSGRLVSESIGVGVVGQVQR